MSRCPPRALAPLGRRRFVATAGGAVVGAALGPAWRPRPGAAATPTLRIAQWAHFVPGYDEWFDRTFARGWGERNGVRVLVDHLSVSGLRARATAEIAAQHGHDLFGFLEPTAAYEAQAQPMTDVVAECERRVGKILPLAHHATYGSRSKQYFGLPDGWAPMPLHFRTDWWGEVGIKPESWENVRDGARKIREKLGVPAGFGLAPEIDSNMVLRGLVWSFGGAEQNEAGEVTLGSPATVEAVKLMTAIYKESMTSDVFVWDSSSNNRAFVWGRASVIANGISALRQAEKQSPSVAQKSALARAPAGPAARLMASNTVHTYVLWKFAENAELARRFLVDLVSAYEEAFTASEFYNLPAFPGSVKTLRAKLAAERPAAPPYLPLADADSWSAYPGHPGYATGAVDEALTKAVLPRMFARAARGEQSPADSVRQADAEMKRIFARWAQR